MRVTVCTQGSVFELQANFWSGGVYPGSISWYDKKKGAGAGDVFMPEEPSFVEEWGAKSITGEKETNMMPVVYIILGILGLGLMVSLIWRKVSKLHSFPCPSWLGWMVEMDNPFTRVSHAEFIVEHLALEPGMKVLDAGCGPGRVTLPLSAAVGSQGEVLAMDIQDGMLTRVKEKTEAAGLHNVNTLRAGLGDGKLPRKHFDRAVMVTVLGEIPDQSTAMQEIFEALKPGGILSVSEVIFDPHFQRKETVLRAGEPFHRNTHWGSRKMELQNELTEIAATKQVGI